MGLCLRLSHAQQCLDIAAAHVCLGSRSIDILRVSSDRKISPLEDQTIEKKRPPWDCAFACHMPTSA